MQVDVNIYRLLHTTLVARTDLSAD